MLCCSLVLFLHFEGDAEAVGVFEVGTAVMDKPAVVEESKVLEPKYFRTTFLLLRDFDILT